MNTVASAAPADRLSRLLPLLETDPGNLALLIDTAEAALDARQPEVALDMLGRHADIAALSPRAFNLTGLAALQTRDFAQAADAFAKLFEHSPDDPAIRFNLAWARANLKEFDTALDILDDASACALPQTAMLRVQLLHQTGQFEDGGDAARRYIALHSDHTGLMAAVSVLALDLEDEALAAACAAKAGDHPDALTTRGTLALGDDHATDALTLFARALERDAEAPRAWVGLGLAKLMTGQSSNAAADIDRGAVLFGDHLGSWVAAGWAYFVAGDMDASRTRFETALALDATFAETHGSLAVLDVLAGDAAAAQERSEIALRLDRQCFSAALARSLLAAGAGDQQRARRIVDLALTTPVDGGGRTIGQSLARMGLGLTGRDN